MMTNDEVRKIQRAHIEDDLLFMRVTKMIPGWFLAGVMVLHPDYKDYWEFYIPDEYITGGVDRKN